MEYISEIQHLILPSMVYITVESNELFSNLEKCCFLSLCIYKLNVVLFFYVNVHLQSHQNYEEGIKDRRSGIVYLLECIKDRRSGIVHILEGIKDRRSGIVYILECIKDRRSGIVYILEGIKDRRSGIVHILEGTVLMEFTVFI